MVDRSDLLNDFENVILADWSDEMVVKRNQPSISSLGEMEDNFVIILQDSAISIMGRLQPRGLINRTQRNEQGIVGEKEMRLFLPYFADVKRFDRIYYKTDYVSAAAEYFIIDDIKRHTLYTEVILKSEL